ncbi:hypothetical protein V8B97DRAFT_1927393 [Scleroderma yunnanense]
MSRREATRAHRLPQRLDYNLIPAPLDLSLPQVTEKSALPAIIVTPSSPSVDAPQFYIAFLNPPPKPSLRQRILQYSPFHPSFPVKARAAFIITLILFILVCHLFVHLVAHHRPHFDFYNHSDLSSSSFRSDVHTSDGSLWNLVPFDIRSLWDSSPASERARSFIVEDLSQAAHR